MRTRLHHTLLTVLCALPVSEASAQESQPLEAGPERLTDRFLVPEGLEVTLWADSPQLYNPTAMDVDARGRVWVTEAVNYRRWGGRNPGREHAGGDRVVILEDTDGDGAADSSKVFVQDPDLTSPLGICVLGSRVFVSCSPNIFVYTDEDGDDVADSREVFLTGFGGFDHDHGVHSIVAGDDGWLYLAVGNAGPHIVTGADGFQLRSGSMYAGGTPYNQDNQAGMLSSDGRVWTGGLLLRVRPDGTGLGVVAHNFRNQYEVALDSFGNLYTADNDDDGNRGCRTTWVAKGGNYGYFSSDGSRSWQADRRPGQATAVAHWHADDPGVMPPGTINGAGGPTGVCVYESEFPDGELALFDGAVLNCDAGAGMVYAHFPARRGAGLYLERRVFLGRGSESGREPGDGQANWFRPSDVVVAPDGSVLVADWYDPGVGGHAMGDREAYGRILRVAAADGPTGRAPHLYRLATPEEVEASEDLEGPYSHLLNALCSPAVSVRAAAREVLIDGGQGAFDALHKLAGDESPRIAARAVMVLARMGQRGEEFCEQVTYHPAPQLRVTAYRALLAVDSARLPDVRRRLARDLAPWVRAAVARSLTELEASERTPLLTTLALLYEGDDRYYLESWGLGALGLEKELGAELRSLHERGGLDSSRYRDLMWRLHPDDAALEFAAWASDESLPPETRQRALDALAFVPTREAADLTYVLAHTGPPDLRAEAKWWIRHRSENLWRAYDLVAGDLAEGMGDATQRWSSGVRSEGLVDVDVDVVGAAVIWLVVTDGGDGTGCDWADWIAPRFLTPSGDVPLSALGWETESSGWGNTQFDKNCRGDPLRIGEDTFTEGIGTHTESRLSFSVPSGATRFVAQAGPDHAGTSQGCGSTMEFQVWASSPEDRESILALRATVMDETAAVEARATATRALAAEPEGGLFLIALARSGRLGQALTVEAGRHIFSNPDLGVRALASEHFDRPGSEDSSLPSIPELLELEGHAGRGADIFFSQRAQCSSCHSVHGHGKDIGPDLTAIRTKYGPAELADAILNPSVAIAFGYDSYVVRTVDDVLYSGFMLSRGADLVLKDSQGRRHVIPAEEVAEVQLQTLSTMPEGVALGLEPQEVADLLAFLQEDLGREAVLGEPVALFNGEDLSGWTQFPAQDSGPAVWSVQDGVLRCEGSPIGYLRTESDHESFELTFQWRFDPARGPGNSGVLLRMLGQDKVWPKSIEAQLQTDNAGDIWNIDAVSMQVDAARTDGRRTRKLQPSSELPLGEWNRYRIRLDRGELTLEVNGVVQNRASWCEVVPGKLCLQSEGAYVEFRNIVVRPILN